MRALKRAATFFSPRSSNSTVPTVVIFAMQLVIADGGRPHSGQDDAVRRELHASHGPRGQRLVGRFAPWSASTAA